MLDVISHHAFLMIISSVLHSLLHALNNIGHKWSEVLWSDLDLCVFIIKVAQVRHLFWFELTADLKLKRSIVVLEETGVQGWDILALTELINKLSVLACHVSCVVACLAFFISEADTAKRFLLKVDFPFDRVPDIDQICVLLDDGAEYFWWNLGNELGVTEWLKVTTVLEHGSRVCTELLPLIIAELRVLGS